MKFLKNSAFSDLLDFSETQIGLVHFLELSNFGRLFKKNKETSKAESENFLVFFSIHLFLVVEVDKNAENVKTVRS